MPGSERGKRGEMEEGEMEEGVMEEGEMEKRRDGGGRDGERREGRRIREREKDYKIGSQLELVTYRCCQDPGILQQRCSFRADPFGSPTC